MNESTIIKSIYRWRIRGALIAVIALIFLARPTPSFLLAGFIFSLFGLFIRAWACCHIEKERSLAVCGPYRYTRNPLYFGNFIIGIGLAIGTRSIWCFLIFTAYFSVFYYVAIQVEKRRMEAKFPEEYSRYRESVPLFFPRIPPSAAEKCHSSKRELYFRNREYRALVGILTIWIILAAKWLILC